MYSAYCVSMENATFRVRAERLQYGQTQQKVVPGASLQVPGRGDRQLPEGGGTHCVSAS